MAAVAAEKARGAGAERARASGGREAAGVAREVVRGVGWGVG